MHAGDMIDMIAFIFNIKQYVANILNMDSCVIRGFSFKLGWGLSKFLSK